MKHLKLRNIYQILMGLITLIGSAYASFNIPITESGIPFTLQSLAVFVIAALLYPSIFVYCLIIYLLLGSFGLPVFADGSGGIDKVLGASGGFLYGFLFSGLFISFCFSQKKKLSPLLTFLIFILATIILFFFGLLHLSIKFDFSRALEYGLYPFWQMAIVKAGLTTVIIYLIRLYTQRDKS